MSLFLLYIIKSSICLAVFYLFFVLVMRRSTLFRFNRITLLVGSLVCLLLPFVPVTVPEVQMAQIPMQTITEILVVDHTNDGGMTVQVSEGFEKEVSTSAEISRRPLWFFCIWLAGALLVLGMSAFSLIQLWRLIRIASYKEEDGYRLIVLSQPVRSFSVGKYIVLSEDDYLNTPAVLLHERMHLRNRHTWDSMWFMLIVIAYWFNPLVWLMRMELQAIHEYEADEGVIKQGIDATQYQLLLVKKAVGARHYSIANGFNHSKLKNRINMMLKKKSSGITRFRLLLSAPVIMGTLLAFARPEVSDNLEELSAVKVSELSAIVKTEEVKSVENTQPESSLVSESHAITAESAVEPVPQVPVDTTIYQVVEEMPEFPGGIEKLLEFLAKNIKYPEEAKKDSIQGRVIIEFIVEQDGSLSNPKNRRFKGNYGHPALVAEAIRVVKLMPKWEPGKQRKQPKRVRYTVPVLFRMK